jgi:very-short-patch-repair endonuclease
VRGVVGPSRVEKRELARELRQRMTPAERALWRALRANRLAGLHFRRQQIIDGFLADFYCHSTGVVLECDGGIHATQSDYDAERDRIIQERGLRVLRFPNERLLTQMDAVLEEILAACR